MLCGRVWLVRSLTGKFCYVVDNVRELALGFGDFCFRHRWVGVPGWSGRPLTYKRGAATYVM
jgi:hypothetical protein